MTFYLHLLWVVIDMAIEIKLLLALRVVTIQHHGHMPAVSLHKHIKCCMVFSTLIISFLRVLFYPLPPVDVFAAAVAIHDIQQNSNVILMLFNMSMLVL